MKTETIDYNKKWFTMAAVAVGTFLMTFSVSIVNVALPCLVKNLNTDFATVQWIVIAYLLPVVTLSVSIGSIADMIGKKPFYIAGFVIFSFASLLCGMAPTIYWLIGFRAIQGIGAAMTAALGMAILTEAFPPSKRGKALGLLGLALSIGIVLGPISGGILIDFFSWRSIFFINLPFGIIGAFMAVKFVRHTKQKKRERFDYPGAVALFISLLLLLMGLTFGQKGGFDSLPVLFLFIGSLFFGGVFIVIELRTDMPMLDIGLFRNNLLKVGMISGFINFVGIGGLLFLLPFYLENVLGFNRVDIGLLLTLQRNL